MFSLKNIIIIIIIIVIIIIIIIIFITINYYCCYFISDVYFEIFVIFRLHPNSTH
jgi:hypothetical protein